MSMHGSTMKRGFVAAASGVYAWIKRTPRDVEATAAPPLKEM